MIQNKLVKRYDPNIIINTNSEVFTTADSYQQVLVMDTSQHPTYVAQIINLNTTNTLTFKIDTTFDGTNWITQKTDTDVLPLANSFYTDSSLGTLTRISVKSKVVSTPATCTVWTRLNPASAIL